MIYLNDEDKSVKIVIPTDMRVNHPSDYCNHIGLAMGQGVMLTTNDGKMYGNEIWKCQKKLTNHISDRFFQDSQGKEYERKKRKLENELHGYNNLGINRLIVEEKPAVIYINKLPIGVCETHSESLQS